MNFDGYLLNPVEIEKTSMEIIDNFLQGYEVHPDSRDLVKRIIHATGDPHFVELIRMSEDFVRRVRCAIKSGCDIITDVKMVKYGINAVRLGEFGGAVRCYISDDEVAKKAKEWNITRAAAAVRLKADEINGVIYVVGNAPTALFELIRVITTRSLRPAGIIATPVGFVGAVESKELLMRMREFDGSRDIPWVTVKGTRGGSTVAAAITNALIYGLSPDSSRVREKRCPEVES